MNDNFFLNNLRQAGGAIWLEGETIRLATPKQFQTDENKSFLANRKNEIIDILKLNGIFSKEEFLSKVILKSRSTGPYLLSFAQERLWFIEKYEEGTNAYHMPTVIELEEQASVPALRYALQQVVDRHEVLRSTIEQGEDRQGIQVVHNRPLQIDDVTLREDVDFESLITEEINRPFDLRSEYPIKVKFYRIHSGSTERLVLMINVHHIACDGWSIEIFQRELFALYNAYTSGDSSFRLPALEIQYKDYAMWQRGYLSGPVLEEQLKYWKEKLHNFQSLNFPTDYNRPATIDYNGSQVEFRLSREVSRQLRTLAKDNNVTLHSIMLSATSVLLSKYTGQDDVVIGSPTANRQYSQTQNLIGFFVNMQVNRILLRQAQSFESLFLDVHQDQITGQLYQDLPFERLVAELIVDRDPSIHPIFQVLFVVQSFGATSKIVSQQKQHFKPLQGSVTYDVTKFDLSVFVDDRDEEIAILINYATSLFNSDTIQRLKGHYIDLLSQLSESPKRHYSELNLLQGDEYTKVVHQWNRTDKGYDLESTIHESFERQVEKSPQNIALVREGSSLTYFELDQKSNQLAHAIRKEYKRRCGEDMKAGTMIALHLDRGFELVVAMLATLKAGGAYVPIDIAYPQKRIDFILDDTGAALVLCQRDLVNNEDVQLPVGKVFYVDLSEKLYQEESVTAPERLSSSRDLAYVIYTSGTTGNPKGVMVEHRNVLSLINNDYIKVSARDAFALLSSPVFDATTFELWTPLLNGSRLTIPKELKDLASDTESFKKFLRSNDISILWLTKTLFDSLYHRDHSLFKDLAYLIIGGEALDRATVSSLARSDSKPKHFLNGYGPTETTTFACTYDLTKPFSVSHVPIGTPINNRTAYILDASLRPVPIGVIGELYIGGAGVSRGYLNNKELTEQRYIANKFATESEKAKGYMRLYKTGDLARWLGDGNIEYMGRNDNQVKIHGYRIELGEIEHAMNQVAGIKQSCVLLKEKQLPTGVNKYLAAYYVLDKNYIAGRDSDIVDRWEDLYDTEYQKKINEVDIESDFTGWNSYITGRAIPLNEMELWRKDILEILKTLNPKNVLEIGVGTGLLMYPLLQTIEKYTGLDISGSVIARHLANIKDRNLNVNLLHLKADDLDKLPAGELYDTIIINSTCQYFPSIQYLNNLLSQVVDKLSDKGSIFFGDVRNLDLHKELIKERLIYRENGYTEKEINRIAKMESELLISPKYFKLLENTHNVKVTVHERAGSYSNELSKYRYDVVIYKESTKARGGLVDMTSPGLTSYYNVPYLNRLTSDDILKQLSKKLPDFMLPGALVMMDSFPATINGKLDIRALPDPDFGSDKEDFVRPASKLEIELCKLWEDLLGVPQVGLADDFFKIGGNSILAIQVSHQMSKLLRYNVTVADIFMFTTIGKLLANRSQKNENVFSEGEL